MRECGLRRGACHCARQAAQPAGMQAAAGVMRGGLCTEGCSFLRRTTSFSCGCLQPHQSCAIAQDANAVLCCDGSAGSGHITAVQDRRWKQVAPRALAGCCRRRSAEAACAYKQPCQLISPVAGEAVLLDKRRCRSIKLPVVLCYNCRIAWSSLAAANIISTSTAEFPTRSARLTQLLSCARCWLRAAGCALLAARCWLRHQCSSRPRAWRPATTGFSARGPVQRAPCRAQDCHAGALQSAVASFTCIALNEPLTCRAWPSRGRCRLPAAPHAACQLPGGAHMAGAPRMQHASSQQHEHPGNPGSASPAASPHLRPESSSARARPRPRLLGPLAQHRLPPQPSWARGPSERAATLLPAPLWHCKRHASALRRPCLVLRPALHRLQAGGQGWGGGRPGEMRLAC